MSFIAGAVIVAGAVLVAGRLVAAALAPRRDDRAGVLAVLQLFAPGIEAVDRDPRALLVWQPLAGVARRLQPDLFAAIDAAAGATFPFPRARIEAAHARWTTEWLTWERDHDAAFKLKAAVVEAELARGAGPDARARLDLIAHEKLETYQRRYEEYVRVGKVLQAMLAE